MRTLLVALFALLSFATGSAAQESGSLPPGTRLRVTVADPRLEVHVGTYQALTDTTLVLGTGSSPRTLPLTGIDRLEWSDRKQPNLLGGVAGFLVGAAVGGALGCAANRDDYGVFCGGQDDTKVYVGAAIGAAAGAALGAYVFHRDRWREGSVDQLARTGT